MSQYRERPECDPECDPDGIPYYASTGYRIGTRMPIMLTQPQTAANSRSPHEAEEDQDADL